MRYAVRGFRRQPGFAVVAVLTLALGIGATTAIFGAVNAVLLKPLPFTHPEQLVTIRETDLRTHSSTLVSSANFVAWRDRVSSFQEAAGWRFEYFNVTGRDEPEQVQGLRASASFLHLMGASAQIGRILSAGDEQPGHQHVVVVSDALWRRRFGAAPDIVGQDIRVEGERYTVVGVLPTTFHFFQILNRPIDLYLPLTLEVVSPLDRNQDLSVYARLRPDASLAQAQSEMDVLYRDLGRASPATNRNVGVMLISQADASTRGNRPALLLLMTAVGTVLLIACANIANLLLARAAGRHQEMALRAALGAGRGRLIRQLLTESVVLAIFGGLAGTLAAVWGVHALSRVMSFNTVGQVEDLLLDGRVLAFSVAVSFVCGIACGCAPVRQLARWTLTEGLGSAGRGTATGGPRSLRTNRLFVVAQLTLAVVLSSGALLLVRSAIILLGTPRGLNLQHVLTMQIWLPRAEYPDGLHAARFFHDVLERVNRVPGVESASVINFPPLAAQDTGVALRIGGSTPLALDEPLRARYSVIDPQYFHTMQIPVLAGRGFLDSDADEARGVAIVSRSMAQRVWPQGDAIGRQIQPQFTGPQNFWDADFKNLPLTIVGIVGDVRDDANRERDDVPLFYVPYQQNPAWLLHLMIRTRSNPLEVAPAVRRAVWSVDKNQPVFDTKSMEDVVAGTFAQPRGMAILTGTFASAALLLAALGVCGLLLYVVSQRTRDIGIRMALGAQQSDTMRLVLRQGLILTAIGLVLGLTGAAAVTRYLRGMLFGVTPLDPSTFVAVSLMFVLVATVASYVPARRATKVDPLVALRCE